MHTRYHQEGKDPKIKHEGEKRNPKGRKWNFHTITKSIYKRKNKSWRTYTCGYPLNTAKFKEYTKVIIRYVIRK